MSAYSTFKSTLSMDRWIYYLVCGALFVMPMGTSAFTIFGACILLAWIVTGEFIRKYEYIDEPWFWPVVAIVVLVWIGIIWSPEPTDLGLKHAKKTHYWLYALAVASIPFARFRIEYFVKAFLLGLFLNSLVGFLQWGNLVPRFSRYGDFGYTGFYGGYNTLSILLVLGMMTASYCFRKAAQGKEKLIYVGFFIAYFLQLAMIESRGGYLTLMLLSPVILHNITNTKRFYVVFFVYLLAIGILFTSPAFRDRAAQTVEDIQIQLNASDDVRWGKAYSKKMDRVYMWRWAIDLFIQNPIIGVGTGGFRQAILSQGGEKGTAHPHNNILYVAVSYGVLGIVLFVWLFWVLLRRGWQNRSGIIGYFTLSACLVILVGGFTDTHILNAGGLFLLTVTIGLQAALPKNRKSTIFQPLSCSGESQEKFAGM